MDNILTPDGIGKLIEVLRQYIVYVYPGMISLTIYRFAMLKNFEDNSKTFIKSVVISYLYTLPFILCNINPIKFGFLQHIIIIIISIGAPITWHNVIHWNIFKKIIRKFNIKTEIHDNIMDIMFNKENGSVWVRAYMADMQIMYEGSLRHYESDLDKPQQIVLSGYRLYNYNDTTKKYDILLYDYASNQKQWVRLLEQHIIRMEFVYDNEH